MAGLIQFLCSNEGVGTQMGNVYGGSLSLLVLTLLGIWRQRRRVAEKDQTD